ncbi:MAG: hypothetical protein QXJ76_05010 [Candidatus Bathyarchaeia archaeon]
MLLSVDEEILCLFPSLDFNRTNVHANSKERMKTLLAVLARVAEKGCVTKYDLTKGSGDRFPRIGGQTAHDVLQELEELGLLKSVRTTNEKGTLKIEKVLTAKGVIACLTMPEFQKTGKLRKILDNPSFKGNKLAVLLKIYNEGYVRRRIDADRNEFSAFVTLIKELGSRGFNLELKTEETIMNDLQETEETGFNELMKLGITDFAEGFSLFMNEPDEEGQQMKQELTLLLNYSLKAKSPQPRVNAEQKTEQRRRFVQSLMNMASPVSVAWLKSHRDKFAHDDLIKAVDRKLAEWKIDDIQDFEQRADYVAKAVQQVMFEQLQKMLE